VNHSLEKIRADLADRRVSIISKQTGLHPNTIMNIRDGRENNPKLGTLNKLVSYLYGEQGEAA
jgi:hypothetical protein